MPDLGLLLEAITLTIYELAGGLGMALILAAIAGAAWLLWNVYRDHVHLRHRRARTISISITGDTSKLDKGLHEALRVIGGSYRDEAPSDGGRP